MRNFKLIIQNTTTMKKLLSLIGMLIPLFSYCQFPEPQNFQYDYDYIYIGEYEFCAGNMVNGPAYCSHFKWSMPDTTLTTAKLESFKIYYNGYYNSDTILIATVTDTAYDKLLGIIGEVWVTAVYSAPNGESNASNIEINQQLPIGIDKKLINSNNSIIYDCKQQTIFWNNKTPHKISIIDLQGKIIKSIQNQTSIDISELNTGLYIVEVIDENSNFFRQKIQK